MIITQVQELNVRATDCLNEALIILDQQLVMLMHLYSDDIKQVKDCINNTKIPNGNMGRQLLIRLTEQVGLPNECLGVIFKDNISNVYFGFDISPLTALGQPHLDIAKVGDNIITVYIPELSTFKYADEIRELWSKLSTLRDMLK